MLMSQLELQSLRAWLAHFGDGPSWSDPSGKTVPILKTDLERLLNTADYSWERFDAFDARDQEQPF